MSRIDTIVLGAGICGLAAATMLARDGRRVTVLERDPAPLPDSPKAAWERWERRGVPQFRQAHLLQARGRHVLADELPDVHDALENDGGLTLDPVTRMPAAIADRAPRPDDDRLTTVTARRPTLEYVLGRAAESQPGLEVRRGISAARLETRRVGRRLRVTGVRDDRGERLAADLVVDATGRGSQLPKLLAQAGGDPVHEESGESGFLYYTRYFRGSMPRPRTMPLTHVGSLSIVTLPAEDGVWSVTLVASAGDRPLKRLRDEARWTAVVRACLEHAHWLDGEPITPVMPMGGASDRHRGPLGAAGVAGIGDAWACTNPSLGRGMTLGLVHAALLRRIVREHDHATFADAFDEATARELEPWYHATVAVDRARLAEVEAIRAGAAPAVDARRAALTLAMTRDAEVFRAGLEISSCITHAPEVLSRPGLSERVQAVAEAEPAPPLGPDRAALLRLLA